MHSSGMRTARLLTVSQHALRRGVFASGPWGDPSMQLGRPPPTVDRQTPVET